MLDIWSRNYKQDLLLVVKRKYFIAIRTDGLVRVTLMVTNLFFFILEILKHDTKHSSTNLHCLYL